MNFWAREYGIPGAFTLVLHITLMAWLLVDIATQPKLPDIKQPEFVKASLVELEQTQPEPPAPAPDRARQQAEEQRRAEQQRQQEQQRREQAEREAAERRQAEEARKRAEAEEQRRAEAERQRREQERQERERREAEQERQRAEEQRRQEQAAREAREQALLDTFAEQTAVDSAEDERRARSYIHAIQQAVIANWNRPASARNDMEALLQIQLVPTGAVVNVNIIESSGNDAFDRSAVAAVRRAERFPELAEMESRLFEKYFRNLRMRFKPEDLRL